METKRTKGFWKWQKFGDNSCLVMKTVNLEEILIEKCAKRRWHLSNDLKTDLIAAMREACNQIVDLCAENAEAYESVGDYPCVSRGSILNTKSQII